MAERQKKAWVVTVDMGYGHQRATDPLRHIAHGGVLIANTYHGIPARDRSTWVNSQKFYEAVSRFKQVPIIGEKVFELYDRFQQIELFYPKRDLSAPTFAVKQLDRMIRRGWGRHLVETLNKKSLPLITSFFATAMMAEVHGFTNEIYCIICDADFSRSWVARSPRESRIRYFASNSRVVERLKLYGVAPERIYFTGFPLPEENVGEHDHETVRADILNRLPNLDPQRRYIEHYKAAMHRLLGRDVPTNSTHPLTVMFAVGGAGAQAELGKTVLTSLAPLVREQKLRLVLIAGVRTEVRDIFLSAIRAQKLQRCVGKSIDILYEPEKQSYFRAFDRCLRSADVLWTKPSELCFYAALGIPIIMAPTIGSQESFNKLWLKTLGAGIAQQDPRYTNEWLMDWIQSGWLARAAWNGFCEAPINGTPLIEKIISGERQKLPSPALVM